MAKKLFLTPAVVKYNYNIFSTKQPWGGGGGEGEGGEGGEGEGGEGGEGEGGEGKVSINFSYLEGGCLLKVGHLLVIR